MVRIRQGAVFLSKKKKVLFYIKVDANLACKAIGRSASGQGLCG